MRLIYIPVTNPYKMVGYIPVAVISPRFDLSKYFDSGILVRVLAEMMRYLTPGGSCEAGLRHERK